MLQQENQTQSATSNGPVRRYPPQASLVILPPLAIAAFVRSGSAQSTPKTKRGIAALRSQVKRVVKDNKWNWQLSALSLRLPGKKPLGRYARFEVLAKL